MMLEPARAFTPFKKPLKHTPTSDLVGGDLQQPTATSFVEVRLHLSSILFSASYFPFMFNVDGDILSAFFIGSVPKLRK